MAAKWEMAIKNAKHHLAVGQKEIWLSDEDEKPWHLATTCAPGGSHRLEISTDVWFYGLHEKSGLTFRWSFDIEPRSANGKGSYDIDVIGVRNVLTVLPKPCEKSFREYLRVCAKAVEKKAEEWNQITRSQYEAASALRSAIAQ
jgi:hypothetical protein